MKINKAYLSNSVLVLQCVVLDHYKVPCASHRDVNECKEKEANVEIALENSRDSFIH